MAGQDPSAGMPPIGVDPASWYELQRRQMTAQLLMQQATTPIQENNMPGQRIRSRLSPIQPIAQVLAAALAGKQMKDLVPDQARTYQQSMVPFGGAPPADPSTQPDQGGVSPSPPPAAQASSPGAGAGGGAPSPAPAGAAPGVGPSPGGSNLNPMGLPPALAMRMFMHDPAKYGELVAGPDGWRTTLMATGGDVEMARRLTVAKLVKEGTLDARPGGMLMGKNPDGTPFTIRNPALPSGVEPNFDANGRVVSAGLIPGVAGAEAVMAGAGAYGKEQGELHEIPTGSGHTRPQIGVSGIPGAGAPGELPPGLTGAPGGAGAAPAPPQYFPPAGGGGGGGTGAGGAQNGSADNWWPRMPKVPQDNTIGEPSTFAHGVNELRAKQYGEHVKQLGLEADTADQKLEYSTELLRNLPSAFTGPQAQGTAAFWNTVNQIPGIRALVPKGATQDAAGTNVVIKNLVNQAIQGARAIYGPRMAQSEVMLQKNEASPSITMGLQAIYALQRQEDAKSAYFIQRKNDFDRYSEQGGDPLRFEGAYQRQFPLAKFASAYAERNAALYQVPKEIAPKASVDALLAHPEHKGDFIARYGYLPPEMRQ